MSMFATTSSTAARRKPAAGHQQRHAHRRFVGGPLVDEAVLAEREPVVSHEHHDCRIQQAALAEHAEIRPTLSSTASSVSA